MSTSDAQTNENSEAFSLPLKNNDLKLMETNTELRSFAWTAALKVQKVYRSYRTRRRLADAAIVADKLWWRALDYARLNQTTVSFFNCSKPEHAASRWNRVSSNASKIGKGLSNEASKALILAFQHWIEAIDPRHRYGHSLQLYYDAWRKGDNSQPFFYWLDVGDGKGIDLRECPRSKLRQQCIKYLGPLEREHYEYIIAEGKVLHKQSRKFLDTVEGSNDAKWIFVMSTNKKLYAGKKKKGAFHHSSFLAGGATLSAGRLAVEDGVLTSISAYSGHYRPTHENLGSFLAYLKEHGVNVNGVQVQSTEDFENYRESKSVQADTVTHWHRNLSGALQLELPIEMRKDQPSSQPTEDFENYSESKSVQAVTVTNWHRNLSGALQLEIPNEMRKDQPSQPTDAVYTETLAREYPPVVVGLQKREA